MGKKMVAALIAATMAACALVGCAGSGANTEEGYLPPGTVVRLETDEGTDILRMIVSVRPSITENDQGESLQGDNQQDYAAVIWPCGFMTNMTDGQLQTEVISFKEDNIAEVVYVGYEGGDWPDMKDAADAARGSSQTASELFLPWLKDYADQFAAARGE